jgi:DNA-directed RNA polymerase sigma subunit (sigma70/sigma32)
MPIILFSEVCKRGCLQWVQIMARLATADSSVTDESGLACYLWEIRRFPMMEPQEERALAKRWREHGDHEAAHKLVNSHLRLVANRQGLSRLRPADL